MAVGRGNTARTEDLVCPHYLPPLGQNSVKVKQEPDGEASESNIEAHPEWGWSWLRKTTSWDAQRQLGALGRKQFGHWVEGRGKQQAPDPSSGWPLAQVHAIIQCFMPGPTGVVLQ